MFFGNTGHCPAALVPAFGAVHDPDHGEHDRHFDQHADDGGERRPRLKAEQADGGGDRQFEEIRSADQGRGAGDAMLFARDTVEQVSEP